MYPHRIRLRGPWACEPLARFAAEGGPEAAPAPLPPACRMTLPCRWSEGGLVGFAGQVRFLRRFGLPRQLDAQERVWLTFAGVEGIADVRLNGRHLGRREGAAGPLEFEVTALLAERNVLQVDVEASETGGLWGEVALEVRARAFLRAIHVKVHRQGETARVHWSGQVVGTCDRPLELYGLLDGSTVAYATVAPAEAGRPFELVSEPLLPLARPDWVPEVRLELVNGAVLWYAVAQALPFDREAPDASA